ncbi:hypothetical protein [Halopseudomonas sp.]|uniref:hypothetical protein n=1 Tax=Halopseudomonas sp. TaxID=2901191 RepID=UPI00300146C5
MQATKKSSRNKGNAGKMASCVSFSNESLSGKKVISKERERYIVYVSAKALGTVSA